MSECLMAQRGGKYTIGRTITEYNLATVHNPLTIMWTYENKSENDPVVVNYSMAVDSLNNVIYLATNYGVYKLSTVDGSEIWHGSIAATAASIAVDSSNNAIYLTAGYGVYKLSTVDGSEIWHKSIAESAHYIAVDSSNKVIYLAANYGVYKLSTVDGSEIWHGSTADIGISGYLESIAVDSSNNAIYLTANYCTSTTNYGVYKLSTVDGSEIWHESMDNVRGTAGNTNIAIDNYKDVVISYNINCLSDNGKSAKTLRKLSGIDGSEIWHNNHITYPMNFSIDDSGCIYIVSSAFGIVWKLGRDGSGIWESVNVGALDTAISNFGDVFTVGYNGVARLKSSSGSLLNSLSTNDTFQVEVDNSENVYTLSPSKLEKRYPITIYKIIS